MWSESSSCPIRRKARRPAGPLPSLRSLGLSATVTRKDGHHAIIFMQCGSVRHRVHAKAQAAARPFEHTVIVRPTTFQAGSNTATDKRPASRIRARWSQATSTRMAGRTFSSRIRGTGSCGSGSIVGPSRCARNWRVGGARTFSRRRDEAASRSSTPAAQPRSVWINTSETRHRAPAPGCPHRHRR
jgi:superfamily II DNA or RNA helicase